MKRPEAGTRVRAYLLEGVVARDQFASRDDEVKIRWDAPGHKDHGRICYAKLDRCEVVDEELRPVLTEEVITRWVRVMYWPDAVRGKTEALLRAFRTGEGAAWALRELRTIRLSRTEERR